MEAIFDILTTARVIGVAIFKQTASVMCVIAQFDGSTRPNGEAQSSGTLAEKFFSEF